MADIIQTFPSGGAGGGHTILDTDGQAVAQESKLQFNGLSVTDDSTNGVTEVEGKGLNQDSLDDIAGAQTLVPAVIIGDTNNYSTTEKVVGKWIDGKPLYQRTFTLLNYEDNDLTRHHITIADLSSLNINDVVDICGFLRCQTMNLPISACVNMTEAMYYYVQVSNTELLVLTCQKCWWSKSIDSPVNVYATIRYTKTTD